MASLPPETAVHHLRNVLQVFEYTRRLHPDGLLLSNEETAAIVVRIKAALRELGGTKHNMGVLGVGDLPADATVEYVVDVVQGARMDGASLGGQEPEHPVSETCPCEACLAAHGTYKPGHSGGLAF